MRRSTLCVLLVLLGFGGVSASSESPRCTDPKDVGQGNENRFKFFYDPQKELCVPFLFKGQGGNSNRFNSDEECVKACSPKAHEIYPDDDKVCSLPKDEGDCFASIPKYYYDNTEKMCLMFLYRGCNGNGNRFVSREDCQAMCGARSGRLLGDLPNPDEKTVNAGLIVGVLGGIVFAGAVISAIVVFVLQKKSKKAERKPVPTSDIEMK
ncbi:BPTI/Kunitz domain-containing protein [Carassius auratus]|uniref:BPTI/Kunitz domain-containing protein n=1 Tax=Carassius auratus TaxID=7957 RepID=A0A6P6NSZ0_CARAU|nr:BPTI/Kunitz domain-containing protein-like [Carassius auratus]